MHIALLVIAALSGLVWGIVHLQREIRRREWAKKNITPLYSLEKPRDLVATLAFALLKCGGELTREQKEALTSLYQDELKYTEREATEMYSYASYLTTTDPNYADKVGQICALALDNFSEEQRQSVVSLLESLPDIRADAQIKFLDDVKTIFRDVRA